MIPAAPGLTRMPDGRKALITQRYFQVIDVVVKSTLLVDPAGQKPNTLNPDLVK